MLSLNIAHKIAGEYKIVEEVFKEDGDNKKIYSIEYRDLQGNCLCKAGAVSSLIEEVDGLITHFTDFKVSLAHFNDFLEDFIFEKHWVCGNI